MASYEKVPSSELEAGLAEHRDASATAATTTKAHDGASSTTQDAPRRPMSPCQRVLVIFFLTAFIGFTVLRGAALASVVTMHCMDYGAQASAIEDDTFLEALRASAPEEFCRLYGEGCEDETAPVADAQDSSIEMPGDDSTLKISLEKRQEGGSNSTSSIVSDDVVSSTTTTLPEPSSTEQTSSSDAETTSQPPDETTTSRDPESTTTEESTTTRRSTTTEQSTTTEVESTTTTQRSSEQTSEPTSESTSERSTSSSEVDETSTTQSSSSRRTVTTGSITTSSAERHTYTTTLPGGGNTVVTSTTWVDFVPTEPTAQSGDEPDLQGSASGWERGPLLQVLMGMAVGAMVLV